MRQDVWFLALLDLSDVRKVNFIIETLKLFHEKLNDRNSELKICFGNKHKQAEVSLRVCRYQCRCSGYDPLRVGYHDLHTTSFMRPLN